MSFILNIMPSFSKEVSKRFIFIFWLGLFFWLALKHTPWRDEYQAWLVSTQTDSIPEFFRAIRYERQPPLYYLILKALSVLTGGVLVKQNELVPRLSSGIFSVMNAYLIFFRLRFSKWISILLPFGILFIFEYGIISRSYSMGIFLLFIAAHRFPKVMKNDLQIKLFLVSICLAAATHLYFTLIGAAILLIWINDNRAYFFRESKGHGLLIGLSIWFLMVFLFQLPPSDSHFATHPNLRSFDPFKFLEIIGFGWTGLNHFGGEFVWNFNFWGGRWIRFGLIPILFLLWKSEFPMGRYFILVSVPLFIMATTYDPALRHAGILFIALLFVHLAWDDKKKPNSILLVFIICQVITTLMWLQYWRPFQTRPDYDLSGSQEVIERFGEELSKSAIAGDNLGTVLFYSVSGRLGIPVFNVSKGRWYRYPFFADSDFIYDLNSWCKKYRDKIHTEFQNRPVLFVQALNWELPKSCEPAEKIFTTTRKVMTDEKFQIFRLSDKIE